MLNWGDSKPWVFLDSEGKNDEESSPTSENVAPRRALKDISLELSRSWVLIKGVKTTSDCIVDFLAKEKSSLLKNSHHIAQLGKDTSTVTTGKQINPKPEGSRRHWYLVAIFSDHVLRISLCQALKIFQIPTREMCITLWAAGGEQVGWGRGQLLLCFWTSHSSFHTNAVKRWAIGRCIEG